MEDFSLFPSDNFIYQLPAKTSTPRSAWEPTSFLPVYFIKTYNASLGRRHNKIQATGLPHVYDNHSWQLFLLQREKAQENGTSIAGSWQVRHGTSSTLGVLSTALLYLFFSLLHARVCATRDMFIPNFYQFKMNSSSFYHYFSYKYQPIQPRKTCKWAVSLARPILIAASQFTA